MTLKETYSALDNLVNACVNNTGHEPSLSIYYRALDEAKAILNQPQNDADLNLINLREAIQSCENQGMKVFYENSMVTGAELSPLGFIDLSSE